MLLSLAINAADFYPNPATSNSIEAALEAASAGDVIYLDDATFYTNVKGTDGYTAINKDITIRAIDGKNPVIKFQVPIMITNNASAKFIGVKFDGTLLTGYDYLIRFDDNSNNSLELEDCEFTAVGKYMIYVPEGKKAASCVIKNCNIHDNSQRIFYNYKATVNRLEINNTEISNCSHYIIHNNQAQMDSCVIINSNAHNNTKRALLNEGTITGVRIEDSEFSYFTEEYVIDNYTNGSIENLKIKDSKFHHNSNRVIYIVSSLDNLDIDGCEFYNNSHHNIDGINTSHTGSCKINNSYFHHNHKCAVYFEKSNSSTQQTCDQFELTNSTIANNDSLTDYLSQIYLRSYNDETTDAIKVRIDHCTFYNNPTLNSDHSNIRLYKLSDVIISNSIFAHRYPCVDVNEGPQDARYALLTYGGTITNCIAHNYKKNSSGFTGATNYINNQVIDPNFTDANNGDFRYTGNWNTMVLSPGCGAATDGTNLGDPRWYVTDVMPSVDLASYELNHTNLALVGNIRVNTSNNIEYFDNKFAGIATRKVHVTKATAAKAVIDIEAGNTSGSRYQIMVFDTDGNKVDSVAAGYKSDDKDITPSGLLYFPEAGDYTIRLNNNQEFSSSKIEHILLSYAGGDVQTIAGTLPADEAWFSNGGTRKDGQITYSSWTDENAWIKWNAATTANVFCNVTLRINTTNAHHFAVNIYEGETLVETLSESYSETTGTDLDIPLGKINLAGNKNFVIKVTNPVSGSAAKVVHLKFEEIVYQTIDLPGVLSPNDAMLSERAWVDNDSILFTARGDEGYNDSQWAKWRVNVTANGNYCFTVNGYNSNPNYESGQRYKITVLSGDESEVKTTKTSAWEHPGAVTLNTDVIALTTGEYVVKVENPLWGSTGRVLNVRAGRVINIDEMETNEATVIGANNGETVDAQLARTFAGGRYNTICLPFAVSGEEMTRVFGTATVKELISSELEGGVLKLNFVNVNSMEAGKPYIIKPADDIENPKFHSVTIDPSTNNASTEKATLIGTFVKQTINQDPCNMYLGNDDKLYFVNNDVTIKGIRAYLHVNIPSPQQVIKHARIVEQENTATDIDLTETPYKGAQKVIENGQLIIIRDGIRYNAFGTKVK